MKILIRVIFLSAFVVSTSCSGNTHLSDKENQVADNVNIVTREENQILKLLIEDTTGNTIYLDTIEMPNSIPELEYAFSHNIKGQPYIIASISYSEDYRDVNHPNINWDKYYTTLMYQCDFNYSCTYNETLSNFFGSGGDLINYDNNEVLSEYPYKTKSIVEVTLRSDFFNDWLDGIQVSSYTIKNTKLNDSPSYEEDKANYIKKNTNFIVADVSSGWLEVRYNKDDQELQGYIKCEDTNLCL